MDIFIKLYEACDIICSFFYSLMNIEFWQFTDFLQGNFTLSVNSIINNIPFNVTIPSFPIPSVDILIDTILTLISYLFYPAAIFINGGSAATVPFYLCFLSFFFNTFILFALIKLVAFIIELIPFE